MGRNVQTRVSYSADSGFLTRLARAIEIDPRRSAEWKHKCLTALNDLVTLFAQDERARLNGGKVK